jgi:hypothetical protein
VFVTKGNSKRLTALMFLALAVGDDSTGDGCMDIAIIDYVQNSLGLKVINPSGKGESVAKDTGASREVGLKLPYSAARELASALAHSMPIER